MNYSLYLSSNTDPWSTLSILGVASGIVPNLVLEIRGKEISKLYLIAYTLQLLNIFSQPSLYYQ